MLIWASQFGVNGNIDLDIDVEQGSLMDLDFDALESVNFNIRQIPKNIARIYVRFYLYTKSSSSIGEKIELNNLKSLRSSNFNLMNPTRFIIHGWINDRFSPVNTMIRDAYLQNNDLNVIVVDWGLGAFTEYMMACSNIFGVGLVVADFIDFLVVDGGMLHQDLTIVGHSLGAHVAGIAGRNIQNGRAKTIVGLDPAGPLFTTNLFQLRLSSSDADYVEVIHTNAGLFGYPKPLGDADFYPNYGSYQPGCLILSCSHSRSYEYFAESINSMNGFWSVNYNFSLTKRIVDWTANDGSIQFGGEPTFKDVRGTFYMETRQKSPFALGQPKFWVEPSCD